MDARRHHRPIPGAVATVNAHEHSPDRTKVITACSWAAIPPFCLQREQRCFDLKISTQFAAR